MASDEKVIQGLNGLLADGTVLYQKLRHYHWNVAGKHFFELHLKFEELYVRWAVSIDEIAERILMVGGVPLHTLQAVLEATSIQEDTSIPAPVEMVQRIEADLEAVHGRMGALLGAAEASGDRGTVNLLDAARDAIEKDLWMLRAWRQEAARAWS
jgi:starvation-inducible DNA-binding protein